jgi:aerotaxis receptor
MTNTESVFSFEELFFSRTDLKGRIISGNSVFKRVSGYEWEELLKKPHNIIRHQDMPRGVFYLFWSFVTQGMPIAAYVKNRSKNGSFYWVLALALPIKEGYISIRLKPSSEILDIVKAEYQKLLGLEFSNKISPEESSITLLEDLNSLGFKDYSTFMIHALLSELKARQQLLGNGPLKALESFQKILTQAKRLSEISSQMIKEFRASGMLPLNLTIQSARIGPQADPLAVVADRYAEMVVEIEREFSTFESSIARVQSQILKCQYSICANLLQEEMVHFFKTEADPGPIEVEKEMAYLEDLTELGNKNAIMMLTSVILDFNRLKSACEQLKTVVAGLEIVRLMGKIEIARLDEGFQQLNHLIGELLKFKSQIVIALQDIVLAGDSMKKETGQILADLSKA